jgi:anti-sigma factor RsiW
MGKRVTLLISKNKSYRDQALHLKNTNDINAYYWMDSKVAYSITGEMNADVLRKLSRSVYQQLNENLSDKLASL